MIDGLKPYPEYRDSGVAWLGAVPAHWEVTRCRYLFREVDARSVTGSETHLSMSQRLGLVSRAHIEDHRLMSESYVGAKLCLPEELVLNRLKAHLGVFARATVSGLVSPDYTVLRPITANVVTKYFEHVLRSPGCRGELRTRTKGLVEGFWRLYTDDLYSITLPSPPESEQKAIVRYLEATDRRIHSYIRAKQHLVALLEEQKQAIVHRAVTRGLDPHVPLKPSGIEWLADVPQHWTVAAIKTLAGPGAKTFVDGDWIESPFITNEGVRLVQTGNIGTGEYREKGFRYVSEETFLRFGCTEFAPGDVLICRLGEPVGRSCLAPDLGVRMITSVDVCILKPRSDILPAFLVYAMSSPLYLDWVSSLVRGSTRDRVSRSMLGGFVLPVPPLAEQVEISRFLDLSSRRLDALIDLTRSAINNAREYRTRLVADVVTGKLDVRAAAANVPAELDESDTLPDGGDGTDDDPTTETDAELEEAEV